MIGSGLTGANPVQAADPEGISVTAKYIVFLHVHAAVAQRPVASEGTKRNLAAQARRLRIQPAEMTTLDRVALEFVTKETLLREEARRYHTTTQARGDAVDPAVVQSFSPGARV